MKWLYDYNNTGDIHNFEDYVLIDIPDDIDQEDMVSAKKYIIDKTDWKDAVQGIVGDRDIVESLNLILYKEEPVIATEQIERILSSLSDAIANNYGE